MKLKDNKNNKIVYSLLDPRKPGPFIYNKYIFTHEPFYIGSGGDYRPTDHIKKAKNFNTKSSHKINKIRKIISETNEDPIIQIIETNLSQDESINLENKLIQAIGRCRDNTGPLTNIAAIAGKPPTGEDHWTVEASKNGTHPHTGRKDITRKRFENKGYNYLCYHADGTPRKKEKYQEGSDWKNISGKSGAFWNSIPWFNPSANKNSRLAWYLKDEICEISSKNPSYGRRRLRRICNNELNLLEKYGYEINAATSIQIIVNSKIWTEEKQQFWQEWRSTYDPYTQN